MSCSDEMIFLQQLYETVRKKGGGMVGRRGWVVRPTSDHSCKMVILTIFRTFGLPWKPVAKTHGPLTVASCRMDLSGPIYAV